MREYALRLGLDLGSTLSAPEVELICSIGTVRHFGRGAILARQEEPATDLHFLQSGAVKTYQTHANGSESVLRIHLTGSIIGLSSLTSRGRWDATSVALQASRTIRIAKPAFVKLLEDRPALALKLITILVDRLSDLHFRIGELQTQGVQQRLAYVLLSLSRSDPAQDDPDKSADINLTHEELSQMINTRRQTVTSALSRLADEGLVEGSNRLVRVLDRAGLEQKLYG